MINEKRVKEYCKEDLSLVENYDKAIADKTQVWHCHHRAETDENKPRKQLIAEGRYWHVPAKDLIFLTKAEHNTVHFKGKPNWIKGKHHSEETLLKISEAHKGKHHSEETRQKLSEMKRGTHHSAETCQKIGEARKGTHHSAETCQKISEAHKGKYRGHWWNNGVQNVLIKECPGPEWKRGRIMKGINK